MHNLIVSEDKMNEDEIRKEKIRNLLTPDVIVCKSCREKYKAETSCAVCGVNMLDPEYKGMVYECPVCGKLYCEGCWNKAGHKEQATKGIFH
ncbi:MAG: hypothetical protein DRN21_02280 [Thermoplasmata archaeon]|nr:MAG: hypothetical protein DRN07_02805 [Thermoplasmata archaeon]RLF40351.1 MAG: hypothetical protein DRN21_02280 [Thermoplasmata archaeon]RLF56829.1 MAG: hypothetical protein DRN37_07540 [Thermoplasmata archaeon]